MQFEPSKLSRRPAARRPPLATCVVAIAAHASTNCCLLYEEQVRIDVGLGLNVRLPRYTISNGAELSNARQRAGGSMTCASRAALSICARLPQRSLGASPVVARVALTRMQAPVEPASIAVRNRGLGAPRGPSPDRLFRYCRQTAPLWDVARFARLFARSVVAPSVSPSGRAKDLFRQLCNQVVCRPSGAQC